MTMDYDGVGWYNIDKDEASIMKEERIYGKTERIT